MSDNNPFRKKEDHDEPKHAQDMTCSELLALAKQKAPNQLVAQIIQDTEAAWDKVLATAQDKEKLQKIMLSIVDAKLEQAIKIAKKKEGTQA